MESLYCALKNSYHEQLHGQVELKESAIVNNKKNREMEGKQERYHRNQRRESFRKF